MDFRLLIKVFALALLLVGIFVAKNFLAGPGLASFFDTLSFQPKSNSSHASSSADKNNSQ